MSTPFLTPANRPSSGGSPIDKAEPDYYGATEYLVEALLPDGRVKMARINGSEPGLSATVLVSNVKPLRWATYADWKASGQPK